MKYAVLYYSETGNTGKIAEQIYAAIDSDEKEMINLNTNSRIPQADFYFVGFPIHKKNCSMKIVVALEQIEKGKVVFFATSGMQPTDKYKEKLEEALSIWLADDVEYLGMFLCQGRTTEQQKTEFYKSSPEYKDKIREMLEAGNSHPDREDFANAVRYVKKLLQYYV
jgi:flavodoxin